MWGTTKAEHNYRLQSFLEVTRKANLKLNKEKCVLGVTELTFVGDILTCEGVKPDMVMVSAIENMPTPECKKDIQRFLGMVNYMGKCIPNLSEKIAPLRKLTEKTTAWNWSFEHKAA